MNILRKDLNVFFLVIGGLCSSFFIGAVISGNNRWFSDAVIIEIINDVNAPIDKLNIRCQSDIYTNIEIPEYNLKNNKNWTVYIFTRSSGIACKATAFLDNHKKLEGAGGSDFYRNRKIIIRLAENNL